LAFVVTTNAQRTVHGTASVGTPEVIESTVNVDRTGRPTQPVRERGRERDLRFSIPRPQSSGAPNGGAASGGVAGIDPFSSQSAGFEIAEGFVVGFIGGQAGWTGFAASDLEGHVDTANPALGDQHLRVGHDPTPGVGPLDTVGGISPNMHDSVNISATVSVDVFITGSGRDYEVAPVSASEALFVTRVRFSRVLNRIEVLDDLDGPGPLESDFVDTGTTYIPDQYVNLTIDLDIDAGTINVFYNGVAIYTLVAGVPFGTTVQEVQLRGINGVDSKIPAFADFDNFSVIGGLLPTGACCNFDDDNGCVLLSAPECASLTNAFHIGDATLCADCPVVDPSCGPGAGDCLADHAPDPGCDDIECCAVVCDTLAFCCLEGFGWTSDCVAVAFDTGACIPPPECGAIGTGSCTDDPPNGTLFCDDTCGTAGDCPGCCDTICAFDPFCCEAQWDIFCIGEAQDLCGCVPEDVPANDECVNAVEVFVGVPLAVANICGTSSLPDHALCNDTFVTGLGIDVWYFHTATSTGALTVTVTPDAKTNWETQLAVYEGCVCNDLNDPEPLACAPLGESLTLEVTNGTCYFIRLGGTFGGPTGTGTLAVEAVPDACNNAVNNCLEPAGTAGCGDLSCCAIVCQTDPACCDTAWDQACADVAQFICPPLPCPAIDIAGANVDEAELCGTDINGGCNTDPAPPFNFIKIVSGNVIHGTAWAEILDVDGIPTPSRDTDWYQLTIDPAADVNLDGLVDVYYSIISELPVVSFLIRDIDPICGPDFNDLDLVSTTAYGQNCVCVNPGVGTVNIGDLIYVFASTGAEDGAPIREGFPCGVGPPTFGNNYLLSVDVVDNGDPSPQECGVAAAPCPWDCQAVADQNVGINDFLDLLGQWTQIGTPCDFGEGPPGVGVEDFLALLGHWGSCP